MEPEGKVQKLSQAIDLSCRACMGTYTSHIHVYVRMLQLPTATTMKKITRKEDNVRFWQDEHLLEVYSVHQHGEGELIDKEMQ